MLPKLLLLFLLFFLSGATKSSSLCHHNSEPPVDFTLDLVFFFFFVNSSQNSSFHHSLGFLLLSLFLPNISSSKEAHQSHLFFLCFLSGSILPPSSQFVEIEGPPTKSDEVGLSFLISLPIHSIT
uniref:Uncharacterized protein n=1 Tax=Opuntia streptacantha TaxID=393608 RepID=A0A7C9E5Y8_OPUST